MNRDLPFWVAEKCKLSEIYRRVYDVHSELYFNQKMFTNGLNVVLPWRAWVEKRIHEMEAQWPCRKDVPSKEDAFRFKKMKGTITTAFLEKNASVNRDSEWRLFRLNSPYLLNNSHIYIYIYREREKDRWMHLHHRCICLVYRFPWLCITIRPYQPLLKVSYIDSIQSQDIVDECWFLLVSQHWCVHQ